MLFPGSLDCDKSRKYCLFKPLFPPPSPRSGFRKEKRTRLVSYGRLMASSFKELTKLPLEESGSPLVVTVLFIDLGFRKGFDIWLSVFKTLRVSFFSMVSSPSPTL